MATGWGVGVTPSWAPASSTTRTCGIRIIWLTRRSRAMADPFERSNSGSTGARTRDAHGASRTKTIAQGFGTGQSSGGASGRPFRSSPRRSRWSRDAPLAGLRGQPIRQRLPRFGGLLLPRPGPRRRGPGLDLAVPEDDHVGHLLLLGGPDLVLHPVRRFVDVDAQPSAAEELGQISRRVAVPVGDRDDDGLDRREPQ